MPLDPEEFGKTGLPGQPSWPISYAEYARWIEPASAFLGCGARYETDAPNGWDGFPEVDVSRVERLCEGRNLTLRLVNHLRDHDGPVTVIDAAVTGFEFDVNACEPVVIGAQVSSGGETASVRARRYAICGGGLETTRLLLSEQRNHKDLFGGASGHLGCNYMGHLAGSVAEISFADPKDAAAFGYQVEGRQAARRRFTFRKPQNTNIVFWVENLEFSDARHGSGIQSLKYLALRNAAIARLFVSDPVRTNMLSRCQSTILPHLRNISSDFYSTFTYAAATLANRIWRADRPADKLIANRTGRYRLAYHAEHLPNFESKVFLGNEFDPHGRPRLEIDFKFSEEDYHEVAAAHQRLRDALQGSDTVTLHLPDDQNEMIETIRRQARDGYHQIGTTAMSSDPADGVVDENCRVHGVGNLFVASSSIFPRSSQANPTLSIVCFAMRLAEHFASPSCDVSATSMSGN